MKNARDVAYQILLKIERDGAYSNLAIDTAIESGRLDDRDNALVSALVYGTLERLLTIDYNLSKRLRQPIKKMNAEVLTALRIGACQLLFMDKIPKSAAVNESVKLIKGTVFAYSAGLINAVLRRIAGEGLSLPDPNDNIVDYYSIKYSCPVWLVSLWMESYGLENAIGIMVDALKQAPFTVRVNTTKISTDELALLLEGEGVGCSTHPYVKDALVLDMKAAPNKLDSYNKGLFHVQDAASQLLCAALGVQSGETVFDLCAAPGGKSFTIAELMNDTGIVRSFDIHENRLDLIKNGALRLGVTSIEASIGDASVYNSRLGTADKVLCDVPCSGFGVMRRKPEIKFKRAEVIDKLPEMQYFILCNASRYIKHGGLLAYSTCTLNPAENEAVCERFLTTNKQFQSVPVLPGIENRFGKQNELTLLPHINRTDGFFIAFFVRTE